MHIDERGHVVNGDETTTNPSKSQYWCGDENYRIAFDFIELDDGRVAIHSIYGSQVDLVAEEFLYDVVVKASAEATAVEMVNAALSFLLSKGVQEIKSNLGIMLSDLKVKFNMY